jgi:hypothetical protein
MKAKLCRALALGASSVAIFGAFAVAETIAKPIPALEVTQILNRIFLGKILAEDEIQTGELVKIDESTMRSILGQPISTHPLTEAAADVARSALGSQGVPYEMRAALGAYEETFRFDPSAVTTYETAVPVYDQILGSQEQATQELVAAIAVQQDSDAQARAAVGDAVELSQSSAGQTQALMAGNQINAAVHGKLSAISAGWQASAYQEARRAAAEQAEIRAAQAQRSYDTRDFVTGAYPGPVATPPTQSFTGYLGM